MFEYLVLAYLRNIAEPLLYSMLFAYRANRSVKDTVNLSLHFILQHLKAFLSICGPWFSSCHRLNVCCTRDQSVKILKFVRYHREQPHNQRQRVWLQPGSQPVDALVQPDSQGSEHQKDCRDSDKPTPPSPQNPKSVCGFY